MCRPRVLVYIDAMQTPPVLRRRWPVYVDVGLVLLALIAVLVFVFRNQVINSPEREARDYMNGLINSVIAPVPEIVPDLSASVAIQFLRARQKLGASQTVNSDVAAPPTPGYYHAWVKVSERNGEPPVPPSRFRVELEQSDDGSWHVIRITLDQ